MRRRSFPAALPLLLLLAAASPGARAGPPAPVHERTAPAFRSPDGKGLMRLLLEPAGSGAFLGRGTFLPGGSLPPHRHEESEELVYVLSGTGVMTLGDATFPVEPGMAIRIPAGTEHSFRVTGDEPVEVVNVYVPGGPERRFRSWEPAPSGGEGRDRR